MGRSPDQDAGRRPDGWLLEEALGGVPTAPVDAMWASLGPRLPGPRGLLHRLPLGVAAVAAAAALLVAAILLFLPADRDESRLRLHVIDVPRVEDSRPLSREEAAEIFFGTEAPVLLGSDLDAGVEGGG